MRIDLLVWHTALCPFEHAPPHLVIYDDISRVMMVVMMIKRIDDDDDDYDYDDSGAMMMMIMIVVMVMTIDDDSWNCSRKGLMVMIPEVEVI